MALYSQRLSEPKYHNWVKANRAVLLTKEGIEPFVYKEIQEFQLKCLDEICYDNGLISGATCSRCCTENVVPCPTRNLCRVQRGKCNFHGNASASVPCPNNICHHFKDAIRHSHLCDNPSYKNTDATQWCSNPWEVAKCFMPPDGYKHITSPAETDFNGLVAIIINYKGFQAKIKDRNIFETVRLIGRDVRWSPNLEIDVTDLEQYFRDLNKLLSDPGYLANDINAREARQKLLQLQNDELPLGEVHIRKIMDESAEEIKKGMNKILDERIIHQKTKLLKLLHESEKTIKTLFQDKNKPIYSIEERLSLVVDAFKEQKSEALEELEPCVDVQKRLVGIEEMTVNRDTNMSWGNVHTVDDARGLMKSDSLPDQQTLEDMVLRFGRKSNVIQFVCDRVCHNIADTSPNIVHVFAAYNRETETNLHFVVLFEDEISSELQLGYNCYCRSCNKAAQTEDEFTSAQSEGVLSSAEAAPLRQTINENCRKYMEKHEYLSAISARTLLSDGGQELCIVMYVHSCTDKYTSIPLKEDPIPEKIGAYNVIVRHGVFKACGDGAKEPHNNIRMGCQITTDQSSLFGTLGGFIDHPDYGLCGFTCAHVVYNTDQMYDLKKNGFRSLAPCLVYQPDISSEPIGRVVQAAYTPGIKDEAGVDLALFQIEERHPVSGLFPSCPSNETLNYDTGRTWGKTRITQRSCKVKKFGITTGCTHGEIVFDGLAVRVLDFGTNAALKVVQTILYNQFEIENKAEDVCQTGDSGGLVLMKDHEDSLVCIGMVNGVLDKKKPFHGVVTPIVDILKELNVHSLKSFKNEIPDLEKRLSERINQIRTETVRDQQQLNNDLMLQVQSSMKKDREQMKEDMNKIVESHLKNSQSSGSTSDNRQNRPSMSDK